MENHQIAGGDTIVGLKYCREKAAELEELQALVIQLEKDIKHLKSSRRWFNCRKKRSNLCKIQVNGDKAMVVNEDHDGSSSDTTTASFVMEDLEKARPLLQ